MYRHQDQIEYKKRKNPRIKNYNYSTPGYYFVTICTDQKQCLFWTNGKRNRFGNTVYDAILKIPEHAPGVKIDKYVVMPNHIHMIIHLENSEMNLSAVIGQFKSYVTKKIHESCPNIKIWQTSFHDHIIRNKQQYEKIWIYIENNPQKWELDCFFIQERSL